MRLNFSRDSPLNATVTNEAGETVYVFKSPRKVGTRTANIYHACTETRTKDGWGEEGQPMMKLLGQIMHTPFGPSTLRYSGMQEVTSREFFRKEPGFWKKKRYWNMPDGRELVWNYGSKRTTLTLNNEAKTTVAQYQNPWQAGLRGLPIYLEIYPEGEDMVDWIILTFAYIQKLREDEED